MFSLIEHLDFVVVVMWQMLRLAHVIVSGGFPWSDFKLQHGQTTLHGSAVLAVCKWTIHLY